MAIDVIECEEFSEIPIRLTSLMEDGEFQIDPRIATRGYLSAAFKDGQVILRTTKFVGLIPLTPNVSIRVRPRASISNLSWMLARSQRAATAISGFSRGYTSRFIPTEHTEKLFGRSLIKQSMAIVSKGLVKRYERPEQMAPWRGRFLAAETVRRHASKGIRYRHEFEQTILTDQTIDNFAIKAALSCVDDWLRKNDGRSALSAQAAHATALFANVKVWTHGRRELVRQLGYHLSGQANIRADYLDALWSAYAVLDGAIPDIGPAGGLRLDSLIVDVSEVFEAFLRRELSERLSREAYKIQDGRKKPSPFFVDNSNYSVHPDIVIKRDGVTVAILDAKYKPSISEQDRYEVLSFMDSSAVKIGGFVSPRHEAETSQQMGTTASGKRLYSLRFDLAASDLVAEADKFAENVRRVLQRRSDLL